MNPPDLTGRFDVEAGTCKYRSLCKLRVYNERPIAKIELRDQLYFRYALNVGRSTEKIEAPSPIGCLFDSRLMFKWKRNLQ